MIKTVIIDKTNNSKETISAFLKNIDDIEFLASFNEFKDFNLNPREVDLIIFDVDLKNSNTIIKEISKLKEQNSKLNFIALSYEINSELTTSILKEGVKDFLLKPVIPNILEASIKKIKTKNQNSAKANTICIFSNKAGVGKTSIAVNLAYELSKKTEEKVCLLDLSFNSEDILTYLNIEQKFNIDYILKNIENSYNNLFLSLLNNYQNTNLYVFSMQDEINLKTKINIQTINKILNALKNLFSYIIIDLTSVIDERTVSILNTMDLILLIGLENLASIRNLQKCYELLDNIGYNKDKVKLIINRHIENSKITIKDIEKTTSKEVFFKIPNNYLTLIDAINRGQALGEVNPQSNIAKAFKNLANEIYNINFTNIIEDSKTNYNHGVFNLLRRMGE